MAPGEPIHLRGEQVRTACKVVTGIYALLCVASLLIIPLNAAGMAGEPDPLTGIFAVLLAAPWIWLTGPITSSTAITWNMVVAGACMALNAVMLWSLCNWISGKVSRVAG
jgi:hypothetical protein